MIEMEISSFNIYTEAVNWYNFNSLKQKKSLISWSTSGDLGTLYQCLVVIARLQRLSLYCKSHNSTLASIQLRLHFFCTCRFSSPDGTPVKRSSHFAIFNVPSLFL